MEALDVQLESAIRSLTTELQSLRAEMTKTREEAAHLREEFVVFRERANPVVEGYGKVLWVIIGAVVLAVLALVFKTPVK